MTDSPQATDATRAEHEDTTVEVRHEQKSHPSVEEMFPLRGDESEGEKMDNAARRGTYRELLAKYAELERINAGLVNSVEIAETARRLDITLLEVAMKTLAQISVLGSELTPQVTRTPTKAEPGFSTDLAAFMVRVENDTFYLDMTSTQKGIKPMSIAIDENGLSTETLMAVMGYMTLTRTMALPKQASDVLIEPDPLAQVMKRLASQGELGGLMALATRPYLAGTRRRLHTPQ